MFVTTGTIESTAVASNPYGHRIFDAARGVRWGWASGVLVGSLGAGALGARWAAPSLSPPWVVTSHPKHSRVPPW